MAENKWGSATSDIVNAMYAYNQQSPDYDQTIDYLQKALKNNPSLSENILSEISTVQKERDATTRAFQRLRQSPPESNDSLIPEDQNTKYQTLKNVVNATLDSSISGMALKKLGYPEQLKIGMPEADPAIPVTVLMNMLGNRRVLGSSLDVLAGAGIGAAVGKTAVALREISRLRGAPGIQVARATKLAEELKKVDESLVALKNAPAEIKAARKTADFSTFSKPAVKATSRSMTGRTARLDDFGKPYYFLE